jgi:Holliday junction resolvasome RuvABC endonuclease subunit
MTSILFLDLATVSGWAFWATGLGRPQSGVLRMPKTGEDVGWFVHDYYGKLGDLLTLQQPGLIVFEAPLLRAGNTSIDTARKLMGLAIITEFACRERRLKYREANNASIRKHFVGKGRGDRKTLKAMTLDACRDRGWNPCDDNEADALAGLDYACHLLKLPVPWSCGGLFAEKGATAA